MEDYSYWRSQSPSPLSLSSLYPPFKKSNEMPSQLINALNHLGGYQNFDPNSVFSDVSLPPSSASTEGNFDLQQPESYQAVDLNSPFPNKAISPPVSPTESDSDSQIEGQSLISHENNSTIQGHKFQSVKRRMQNREAQRRFRERKEERQKALEQKILDLQAKCQELSDGLRQKSEEVSKEKEALQSEIQDLRKRWRLMVMLLQRPKSLQSLSTLLAEDPGFLSGSADTEAAPLDEFLGCLDALLLANEKPHKPS